MPNRPNGCLGRTRTDDPAVNSRMLYQLSYKAICFFDADLDSPFIPVAKAKGIYGDFVKTNDVFRQLAVAVCDSSLENISAYPTMRDYMLPYGLHVGIIRAKHPWSARW